MANPFQRLRASLEPLIFAGLKPGEKPLRGPMTLGQKLGIVAGILLVGVFVYVLVSVLRHPAEQAESTAPAPPPVEIVPKDFKVDKNKDLEVVEINFDKNKEPKEITGTLRNLTDRSFAKCEISFDVTTRQGEQLGGVTTTVNRLAPHGSVKFRILVPQKEAGFAMVRELRTD
jgi:hypothetical protein